MMTCQQIADFLNEYLENSLPFRQRMAFQFHLLLCRDCRRYLDSYQKTRLLLQSLSSEEASVTLEPAPEGLVKAILSARASLANEPESRA